MMAGALPGTRPTDLGDPEPGVARVTARIPTRNRLYNAGVHPVAVAERKRRTPASALSFVGCVPARVSAKEIDGPEWEGQRLEYWDAATETAWLMREPVSPYHERPATRLAQLVERICEARGSGAQCFGNMDLRFRETDGTLTDIMQADQSIILHPERVQLPGLAHLIVGEHDLPDVVLEVDNTTDVRRGKLIAYREWGFPEVWVEVPEVASPGRPRGRRTRLVIHLLDGDDYRESEESRAFPTWRAAEIHLALNEPVMSEETEGVLWRVGRALGQPEGTSWRDDAQLRRVAGLGHAEGHAQGHAQGHAEGHAQGRARGIAETAASMLHGRGVRAAADRILDAVDRASPRDVVEAARRADSETDFLARLARIQGGDDRSPAKSPDPPGTSPRRRR